MEYIGLAVVVIFAIYYLLSGRKSKDDGRLQGYYDGTTYHSFKD